MHASSREVYGDAARLPVCESFPIRPKNVYGLSKIASEYVARMNSGGLEVCIVRLANVYGSGDHGRVIPLFIGKALRNEPLRVYGGGQIVDFIAIQDAAKLLHRAALVPAFDQPVNIGSGMGTRILDLARRIVLLARSQSRIHVEAARPFEVQAYVAEPSRSRAVLGYEPVADPLERLAALLPSGNASLEGGMARAAMADV